MKNYGMPYLGSKNTIALAIVNSSQNLRAEEKLFMLKKNLKEYEDPNEADVLPCFRTDYAREEF